MEGRQWQKRKLRYIFEDNYVEECKGMSKEEIAHREKEHGKLKEVVPFQWYEI